MPDGRTHFAISIMVDVGVCFWAYDMVTADQPERAIAIMAGSIIGTFITPDYDLEQKTYTERLIRSIPVVGKLWQNEWYLYALFSEHRKLSHVLFLGTLSRVLYALYRIWAFVIFLCGLGIVYFGGFVNVEGAARSWSWLPPLTFMFWLFLGWSLQDAFHIFLDFIGEPKQRRPITIRGTIMESRTKAAKKKEFKPKEIVL